MTIQHPLPRRRVIFSAARVTSFRGGFTLAFGVQYKRSYGRTDFRVELLFWQIDVCIRTAKRVQYDHGFEMHCIRAVAIGAVEKALLP